MAMRGTTTLVYSPQCPNCMRFLDALKRTPAARDVVVVDLHTLGRDELSRLAAVPALVMPDGTVVYGTKAFEWLKQFEADMELDSFVAGRGSLAFSDLGSAQGYATYAESFSPFEAPAGQE